MITMRILYCSYSKVPSDYANSLAVMKQCDALSKVSDLSVILIKGDNSLDEDVFLKYGVNPFHIILLPQWTLELNELGLRIFVLLYAFFYRPDVVYSRDILLNGWLCYFKIKNIYEIHQLDQEQIGFDCIFKKYLKAIMTQKSLQTIVCISRHLASKCTQFGVPSEKLTVLPSGVDLNECKGASEVRITSFIQQLPLVMYVGSLQKGKGIDIIQQMAQQTTEFNFLIIGGRQGQIQETENLKHIPRISHHQAICYMKSADFLLLPLTEQKYKFHSPLKLFEYMAMGKPIIASDNLDVREIITPMVNGILADPRDPNDFLNKIKYVHTNPRLAKEIGEKALSDAAKYTWDERALRIIHIITLHSRGNISYAQG